MKYVRLILSLAIMVPPWALIGGFSALDGGERLWWGLIVGGLVGVLFGLIFGGGIPSKWANFFFGAKQKN